MKKITNYKENPFKPFAKLNFYSFDDLILNNIDANSMELSSSSINKGEFHNVNFFSSSFLSTKFSAVNFNKCEMSGSDICSVWCKDCIFFETNFDDSTITDSIFINCRFKNSTLKNIMLSNTQFIDCVFEQMPIENSTVTLNTFTNCIIRNTNFTESFYYQIFEKCEFFNVELDPVLLGYNFGFSKDIFAKINKNIDLTLVEEDFINNYFLINAAILHINQASLHHDLAMLACVTAMCQMIRQDILVKNDEIQFLKRITSYLNKNNMISPFIQMKMWQYLTTLLDSDEKNVSLSQAMPYVREYANTIYFDFQNFQKELEHKLNNTKYGNSLTTVVEIEIVYSIAPAFQLVQLLEHIRKSFSPDALPAKLLYSKQGSFIEKLQIAEAILPYFETFLSLLGCVIPFIIYRMETKNTKNNRNHSKDNEEKKEAKIPTTKNSQGIYIPTSPIIIPHIKSVEPSTSKMIADITGIIVENGLSDSIDFYGYNYKNIKSITITFENSNVH